MEHALTERADVLRAHRAAGATVLQVARSMAAAADHATGRGIVRTRDALAAAAGVSISTLKRAKRVLAALGLATELLRGRLMRATERATVWARGSRRRHLASEWACTLPRTYAQIIATAVDRGPPPRRGPVKGDSSANQGASCSGARRRRPAARAASTKRTHQPAELEQVRQWLTAAQQRASWLTGVSPRRALGPIRALIAAGWTPADLVAGTDQLLQRNPRWSWPDQISRPWAYLAWLVRTLDLTDRPGAQIQAQRTHLAQLHDWEARRDAAAECPHGTPGGNLPSPTGTLPCPMCRRGVQ